MNVKGFFVYISLITCSLADLPSDPQQYAQWEQKSLARIEELSKRPPEELIPNVGRLLMQLTFPYNRENGSRPVFKQAQMLLLRTPGHAQYYEHRIKAAQEKYFNATDISIRGPAAGNLCDEIMYGFRTLGQLPSPETVRVLGEFLDDRKGVDENGELLPGIERGTAPVCSRAAQALNDLPLKSRPMPYKRFLQFEHVRTWQLWYQQIKAGNRTFSFEGDPNEYDLNGPIHKATNPDIPRAAKRPPVAGEAPPSSSKPSAPNSTPWIAGIFAAILTLGGLLFLRKKPSV